MATIVLLGPVCAGKSTLASLVADAVGVPCIDLDDIAEPYYEEVGRGRDELHVVGAARGDWGAYEWWQVGHPHAVQRALDDHAGSVISLGAGHSHYTDESLFVSVAAALEDCFTVYVLPSSDPDRSVAVIRERSQSTRNENWILDGHDMIDEWVRSRHNRALADVTVFTEGRTPEETAGEIVSHYREWLSRESSG